MLLSLLTRRMMLLGWVQMGWPPRPLVCWVPQTAARQWVPAGGQAYLPVTAPRAWQAALPALPVADLRVAARATPTPGSVTLWL